MKKWLAVLLSMALLMSAVSVGTFVGAHEARTEVEGARWFPCQPGRENDLLWEVECDIEGCLCQPFNAKPEETGCMSYLNTTYGKDGSLTLTRTGADGNDFYWPRVRTLLLEVYPKMDMTTANTLYFDLEAVNCQWNIMLGIEGMGVVKLPKYIVEACGGPSLPNTDTDGPAGYYKGSINLMEVFADILANESGTESWIGAQIATAVGPNTQVPQIQIFYVGDTNGSLTINELFISTPDDVNGANCEYMDMGAIVGDEWYDSFEEEPFIGDLNGDGGLDMRDAFALYAAVSGGSELTDAQKAAADMNGDGEYDMRDAFALYLITSGG